ncbi:hypothetical protein D9M69_430860 [compost metagenome]
MNAADLGLDQGASADGFLIDALRAAHRDGGVVGHVLGGRGHLVHGRGDLFDLAALVADGLVALARHQPHPPGMALDLGDGVAHLLDQLVDPGHGGVERLAQFAQFIPRANLHADGHVAFRHPLQRLRQVAQCATGGEKEPAIEVEDQQHDQQQPDDQHGELLTLLQQAALQLLIHEGQAGVAEALQALPGLAVILVELLPGHVQAGRLHYRCGESTQRLLQGLFGSLGPGLQRGVCEAQLGECLGIVGLGLFQHQQQIVEPVVLGGGHEPLDQRGAAHGLPLAKLLGHLRQHPDQQATDQANVALAIQQQPRLGRDELGEYLLLAEQARSPRRLTGAHGRLLQLHGGIQQQLALVVEFPTGLGVVGQRAQGLQALDHLLLEPLVALAQFFSGGPLPQGRLDLHLLVQVPGLVEQPQCLAERRQAGPLVLAMGELAIALGGQVGTETDQGQEEHRADQAELQVEAQPVHQQHGRIEQTMHEKPPGSRGAAQ